MSDLVCPRLERHKVRVGGLPTVRASSKQFALMMVEDCLAARDVGDSWRPQLVFSSNGQGVALAATDPEFAAAMAQADLIHADGMSVVFASRKFGDQRLPERVATTDFIIDAANAAEEHGLRFFVLGGTEEANAGFVSWLGTNYPGLQVVGRHHGFFDIDDEERVMQAIRSSKPDVLWVALGKPKQEHAAIRYRDMLPGVGWIKTCGGLYEYYSGHSKRAPSWMQRIGCEWLYRALANPRRYAMRYLSTNFVALRKLLIDTY